MGRLGAGLEQAWGRLGASLEQYSECGIAHKLYMMRERCAVQVQHGYLSFQFRFETGPGKHAKENRAKSISAFAAAGARYNLN